MIGASSDIGSFGMVPTWLALSSVSSNAIKLFAIIAGVYADRDTGEAWPSRKTLSGAMRCSESTIDRTMTELETIGAIVSEARFGADGHQTSNRIHVRYANPALVTRSATPSSSVQPYLVTDDQQTRINDPEPMIQSEAMPQSADDLPMKALKTEVTQRWLESIRPDWEGKVEDFDEQVKFSIRSSWFEKTKDRQGYVLGQLRSAAKRHASKPPSRYNPSDSAPGKPWGWVDPEFLVARKKREQAEYEETLKPGYVRKVGYGLALQPSEEKV